MKIVNNQKYNNIPFYIILISIIISIFLMFNISYRNNKSEQEKYVRNRNILRNLDFDSDSLKICSRSSDDLVKYFETGDTSHVSLYTYKEDKEPSNITIDLINIITNEGNAEKNNKNYLSHLAPMVIFCILGVLCIPGWFIFCSMACCDCKCFRCCQEPKLRIPFFIVVSILNLIFIVTCVLGLIKIKPIFEGLSNSECSLLKFISETLDGETKNNVPKWGGISEIINIFNKTVVDIEKMCRDDTLKNTENNKKDYIEKSQVFIEEIKYACNNISSESRYKYGTNYVFDLANDFGKYETGNKFTSGSYAERWLKESEMNDELLNYYNNLETLIKSHVTEHMIEAQEIIQDIGQGIQQIKDGFGENILEYSDRINKYGKLICRLIFIVLLIISMFMQIFFTFLFLSSYGKCKSLCCEIFMKGLIHIFWNILILFVIILFLFGGLIIIISTIGKDIFEAISFVLSTRNLLSPSPRIFGDSAPYLDICINDDGNITDKLGITKDLENIGKLKTATEELGNIYDKVLSKFQNIGRDIVYEDIISELNKRRDHQIDYGFINPTTKESITLYETISELNEKLYSCNINDTWSISCSTEYPHMLQDTCDSIINTSKCINLYECREHHNTMYPSGTCNEANVCLTKINEIETALNIAHSDSEPKSIKNQASNVNSAYQTFISNSKQILETYTEKFRPLSVLYNNYVGNGSALSIINCAFIGKNVKVLLNYLNETIGKSLLILGIILVVNGFIMLCSITFSIFLLLILDEINRINRIDYERKVQNILSSGHEQDDDEVYTGKRHTSKYSKKKYNV